MTPRSRNIYLLHVLVFSILNTSWSSTGQMYLLPLLAAMFCSRGDSLLIWSRTEIRNSWASWTHRNTQRSLYTEEKLSGGGEIIKDETSWLTFCCLSLNSGAWTETTSLNERRRPLLREESVEVWASLIAIKLLQRAKEKSSICYFNLFSRFVVCVCVCVCVCVGCCTSTVGPRGLNSRSAPGSWGPWWNPLASGGSAGWSSCSSSAQCLETWHTITTNQNTRRHQQFFTDQSQTGAHFDAFVSC